MWHRVSYKLASPGRRRCEELPCYWKGLSPGGAEAWKEIVGCGRKAICRCEYTAPSRWYSGPPPSLSKCCWLTITYFPDFLSTGRYRLLVLASSDLLRPSGQSATALSKLCS